MTARIAVIGGGSNVEHDVSLASAEGVAAALTRRGYAVERLTIGRDGEWTAGEPAGRGTGEGPEVGASTGSGMRRRRAQGLAVATEVLTEADAVFPAVHGPLGEDGALAALCALAGVPVVGSGHVAGAIGMDKHFSKLIARDVGVRTAAGRVVTMSDGDSIELDGEAVVKPVASGSSHGVSLVRGLDDLGAALAGACAVDASGGRALVEPLVRGREIDVAVLREADGTRWAAPALEIHAPGLFDTATKYDGSARFTVPAELRADEAMALERAALAVFDAFGCRGVARIDFFLTADGPVFNEINTMPGLTPASQVPRMFAAAGVDYEELVHRLVQGALRSRRAQA